MDENIGDGTLILTQRSPVIGLLFSKGLTEQLSVLPRGASVTIRCRVMPSKANFITLMECELL
jgi:hypothetical protein